MRLFALALFWAIGATEMRVASFQKAEDRVERRCPEESVKRFGVEAAVIGGDVKPPKKLVDSQPELPDLPPGTTASGIWIGEILVGTDGLVADAWAMSEPKLDPPSAKLTPGILDALRKWEYEPLKLGCSGSVET